jgi:GT2 family glycosyltransferase
MKIISIIIPVHNRLEVTKEGIRELTLSLKSHKLSNKNTFIYEIIVVDDGSTDGTSKWIIENYPSINILKGDGNLWWSGAVNLGVKYSIETLDSEHVILWNNDIFPQNNFFKQVEIEILKNNNNIILGSLILDSKNDSIWANGGLFNSFTGRRSVLKKLSNKRYSYVDWLPGMGTVISKEIILKIGFWDQKNLPQYHGDIDFCLRAKNKGIDIIVCEEMVITNRTEYSSFVGSDFNSFLKSLVMVQSRYCVSKEILFLFRHTKSPLWVYYLTRKYLGYILLLIRK